MARFDVWRGREAGQLLLECQSDLLRNLATRLVVPLLPLAEAPVPARRLNPVFTIDGAEWVMGTQFAAAVPVQDLREKLMSLREQDRLVIDALDTLLTGW
jgi:toxin CcdB